MRQGALKGAEPEQTVAFWKQIADLQRSTSAANQTIGQSFTLLKQMRKALKRSQSAPDGQLDADLYTIEQKLYALQESLGGNQSKNQIGEKGPHTVGQRLFSAMIGTSQSTYGPTPTHKRSLQIAEESFSAIRSELNTLVQKSIPALQKRLIDAGAPWTSGVAIP